MITFKHVEAVFIKQVKDVRKDIQVLTLFFVYPLIAFIMCGSILIEGAESSFFITIFSTMHSIFTPIVVTAAIIAEEKEKNTLRVLMLSGVRPMEYLLSIGGFVLIGTLITSSLFVGIGNYSLGEAGGFLGAMAVGSTISVIMGMTIGAYAPNMMSANGLAVPIAMCFAFLPMLASFNEKVEQVARFTYSQQISQIIEHNSIKSFMSIGIILVNSILIFVAFIVIFKRNRLDI